jgi:beta-lactam-binding protein with PASTA domain
VAGVPPEPAAQAPPAMVTVPSVVGFPLQAAINELRKVQLSADLVIGKDTPGDKKPYVVYYQEPEAGTQLAPQSNVTIVFYGRSGEKVPQVAVPNVIRMLKEEAEQAIKGAGLTPNGVGMKVDRPPSARHKEVYEQDPAAKQLVPKGQTVAFRYYAFIKVPYVVGMRRQQAEQTITRVLLKPDSVQGDKRAPDVLDAGNVYEQSPDEGTLLAEGEPVRITFYKELGGFQDGDGKFVDGRFAAAVVTDGAVPGTEGASSGARTAIHFSSGGAGGERSRQGLAWFIRRYAGEGGARAFIAKATKDPFFTAPDVSVAGTSLTYKDRVVGGEQASGTMEAVTPQGQLSTHMKMVIYRGQFLIYFIRTEPQVGLEYAGESARIIRNSQALIDKRFPVE